MQIATMDTETDPFLYGRTPVPFVLGFFDGADFRHYWGEPDEIMRCFFAHLESREDALTIYVHNGGKFDFHFMLRYMQNPMLVINGRIVKFSFGKHEFRDSFAAVPVGLDKYKKTDIDYAKFEAEVRRDHRKEIVDYLEDDCVYLHEMMTAYVAEFGDRLTMASASMHEFKAIHDVQLSDSYFDAYFRQWYAGGRCQAFEKGALRGDWKVYDVNSMYPSVMRNMYHPMGTAHTTSKQVSEKQNEVSFVCWQGKNYGAVGGRDEKGGFTFAKESGEFVCTSHEFFAGLDTGTIKVDRVVLANTFPAVRFEAFIDIFYSRRMKAREDGRVLHDLFYKLVMNSAYGRFGMNPDEYERWEVTEPGAFPSDYADFTDLYSLREMHDRVWLWSRPDPKSRYMNVAVAASITGAARAMLLRGIAQADRPVYCDTDSIICEGFSGETDESRLGAWKLEGEGDMIYIGGKKLYALYDGAECVKKANKGVKISGADIQSICRGDVVTWRSEAPSFSLKSGTRFIERRVRSR